MSLSEAVKLTGYKEHLEALKNHIQNTQDFLKREASDIETKVT